jgi:hypothetical protein
MWIERHIFAIIDEHFEKSYSQNITRQMSIKIDALENSVYITFH